jgi:hypothetical protein
VVETREIVEGDFPACVDIFDEGWIELVGGMGS